MGQDSAPGGRARGLRRGGQSLSQWDVQVAAQHLSAGSGGIARCARLSVLALGGEARVRALSVEDNTPVSVGDIEVRTFSGHRPAFVAANALGAMASGWTLYDFAGTARAHGPLGLLGRPYGLWVHGWEVWPENLRSDYARVVRGASAVFANSRHTQRRLAESLPGLKTVHCCPLGAEYDTPPLDGPAPPRERMVLFVGRNDGMFAKGQDLLIAAWPKVRERIPDAQLCFVGGGGHLSRLRELASASPASGSIKVLGQLSDPEVAALYRRARLFAMLSEVEGFGLVFAEAMSHGLPILTSRQDASQEINIEDATGFSVDRSDLDAITDRIVSVLLGDALFERLSAKASEHWSREYRFSAFRGRFLRAVAEAGLSLGPTAVDAPEGRQMLESGCS
jgi:phosphatidylinositol alpha-1,6-mannosyltransferase